MKKKLTLWLLTLTIAIVSIFSLVACGGSYTGTYKFYSMTTEVLGETVTLKAGDTYLGIISLSKDFITVELKDDGTVVVNALGGFVEGGSGKWEVNENDEKKVDLTINGAKSTWTWNGNQLTMEKEGVKIVLKK